MFTRLTSVAVALLALCLCVPTFAQPADQPPGPPQRGPGGMGGPMGPGGMGGAGMFGRDGLGELIAQLGELNLSPEFTLTKEQKEKIKAIRDEHRKQMEKWRADKAEDFKKLDERVAELREKGDREGFGKVMQDRQKLMADAPKSDEAAKQIKAVLNEEQAKQLDAKLAEIDKQRREMRQPGQGRPEGGPREGGPREGGPREGAPREGGPRDGGQPKPERPDRGN